MKLNQLFIGLAPLFLVYGCTTGTVKPQTAVYQVENGYQVALAIAVAYKNLPPCGQPTSPIVCSDPMVVAKLQQADAVAAPALQAAQNAVRDPNFNASASSAVLIAAQQALNALTTITATLKVK